MANSDRIYKNSNNDMFIPMNVEGGTWDEHFINTKKLITIGVIVFSVAIMVATFSDKKVSSLLWLIGMTTWIFVSQLLLRYVVFEEKSYYAMYQKLKKYEITTPAIFWNIASINDTNDGAILIYTDMRMGVLVKLDRDTITGKHPDFKEVHYDAVSDFYRSLMQHKFSYVQLNMMEKAGNDPRLDNLDKLVYSSDNSNINSLMEKQIGYIKNMTRNTLCESDYFLIYTSDISRMNSLISDVAECMSFLLDGAYIEYTILNTKDIIDNVKEEYGVKYFNYVQATLEMYKITGVNTTKPFDIAGIIYTDGETQKIELNDINKINNITSDVLKGTVKINSISIKDAITKNKDKEINGIDLDTLSVNLSDNTNIKPIRGLMSRKNKKKNNSIQFGFDNTIANSTQTNSDEIDF